MKILVVIPANLIDGVMKYSTFIETEVKSLIADQGLEVEKFYFVKRNSVLGFIKELRALNSHIQNFKPDIIHSHYGATTGLLVSMASKKCPWIATYGGSELLGHPNKGVYWRLREFFSKRLSHYSADKADCLICVSENLKMALSTKNQNKCSVIPRGVNTIFFSSNRSQNYSNVVLFSLPRMNATVKNLPLAEKVLELYNSKNARELSLEIIHNKSQVEIRELFERGDLLLVTSTHEGSPNIVKEAMASDLPIVSVDCGDVATLLDGVSDCYVSSQYDAVELAGYIEKIYGKGIRSTNGRIQLYEKGLSIDACTLKIHALYKTMI